MAGVVFQEFFQPALENIRLNAGDSAVSDEHMQTVCRQILEEVLHLLFEQSSQNQKFRQ